MTERFDSDFMVKTNVDPKTVEDHDHALWCGVVQQAVLDAVGREYANGAGGSTPKRDVEVYEARVWFVRGGKDFNHVCSLAGVEPEVVQKTMLQRIADVEGITPAEVIERYSPKRKAQPKPEVKAKPKPKAKPMRPAHITMKDRKRTLTHNGKTMTVSEWSNEIGIRIATINKRISLGWSVEYVLSTEKYNGQYFDKSNPNELINSKRMLTYEGVTHPVTKWAELSGIPYNTLCNRIDADCPVEELFKEQRKRGASGKRYTYDGKTLTVTEWCKELDLGQTRVRELIRMGQPLVRTKPKHEAKPKPIVVPEPEPIVLLDQPQPEPMPIVVPDQPKRSLVGKAWGWVKTFTKSLGTGVGPNAQH